jgi:hypothetical protein
MEVESCKALCISTICGLPTWCSVNLELAPYQAPEQRRYNICMYHYDPNTALEELTEDATLPNPVHVRDMMLRKHLSADKSLELNRLFVEYQKFFGETQKLGNQILRQLAE